MITRDDWMRALEEASQPPDVGQDVLTIAEFAKILGITPRNALPKIAKLVEAGRAVPTHKQVKNAIGRVQRYPAYRLVQQ